MTQPGSIVSPSPSWWPRPIRVGVTSSTYGWNVTAQGQAPPALSMTGSLSGKAGIGARPQLAMTGSLSALVATKPRIQGTNVANATSVAIPTHAVGDLIVLFVRESGADMPTKPSSGGTVPAWVDIDSSATGSYATCRTVHYAATATNHTTGTWTGADGIIATVLRGVSGSTPIGGHAVGSLAANYNYTSAPAVTLAKTDGTSMLLHFFGLGDGSTPLDSIGDAPTGYTQRAAQVWSGLIGLCLDTKNITTSDGAVDQATVSTGYTCGASVEVRSW